MSKKGSILLSSVVGLSLVTGCASGGETKETPQAAVPNSPPVKKTFTMLTESNPSWPYSKDWPAWKWIEEKTGVTLDVRTPPGKTDEAVNLAVASGQIPDLMIVKDLQQANKFGQQGAFVNILDYKDQMPNFKKWMEKYPDITKEAIAADGKMYQFPNEGFGETNRTIWMDRDDIFKKEGLKAPATYDELYEVLKQLKAKYPDSYPLSFRIGGNRLQILKYMAPGFGTHDDFFYDKAKKDVRYGPTENEFKTMIEYMNKFYKDGLIPPDFLTLETKQWQDMMAGSKSFITVDYIGRIDFFNLAMRKENPQFTVALMAPPAGGANGKQQNAYTHTVTGGFVIASKAKDVKDIMKFMDFFYSEEGKTLASWGKEGESYTLENGTKKMKADFVDVTDLRKKTGLATYGTYQWIDYDAHLSLSSKELQAAYPEARKYDSEYRPKPSFNENELEIISTTGKALEKSRDENLSKFILGERKMAEWDQFVAEQNKLGLDKIKAIYKTAYERTDKITLK
ncbi:extracellular solute-binding protein [Paenibacillus sp. WQ 127069]|uniref:Extracellular solute-binding protein n=1 Tax=Paenibacillus baimaensis TaxID=2982185 RepID=A0ABT2UN65_9BACL|nr:extracellular solute-binding protein [Paenibacillus sp. WQ 127069]MCU6796088.1 extracellular solute-binding protein [Paenibacillus sp. WQ 127069]